VTATPARRPLVRARIQVVEYEGSRRLGDSRLMAIKLELPGTTGHQMGTTGRMKASETSFVASRKRMSMRPGSHRVLRNRCQVGLCRGDRY